MSATTLAAASTGGGYLNTAEVRQRFFGGLSDQTIWKFIKEDGLPAHQVKRRWYFDPTEVDAWIRSRGRTVGASAVELDEHVRALVDQFPPLSEAQIDRIALLLRANGGAA